MDQGFTQTLGIIVIAAAVCAVLARLINLPGIVAYLIAGLAIGPFFGWVEISDPIHLVSELGIVILLFLVGLELSLDKVRDTGKVAIAAGLGQVVFTAVGGYLFCWLLGFSIMEAVFLAVGLTFSSTVVVVKILADKAELDTLYGRIAVGIFLVQDIVVIIVLTVLAGLGTWDDSQDASLVGGLARAFGGMVLVLGGVLLASRWLLPKPFAWAARSPSTLFIFSLAWCFTVVGASHILHLSIELGAFFAGLSLAQLPYNKDLQHRIKPLMNFFVAVFFVALGANMAPAEALVHWLPVLLLSLFVLIGNPLIFIIIISRMGYGERTAFFTSVTVAQISEFSFIFAAMGVASGLVSDSIIAITAMVGVITIAASAYMIIYNRQLYQWCRSHGLLKIFRARDDSDDGDDKAEFSNHVIIVGMNTLGRMLAAALHEKGETVVAIDTDPAKLRGLRCHCVLGNAEYLDVLLESGLPRAKFLISAIQIEEANDLLAYRCRQYNIPCSIHAIDLSVTDNLLDLGATHLMLPKVDGVKLQARVLKEKGLVDT